MLKALLIVSTIIVSVTASAAPERVYPTGDLTLVDKGSAQDVLLENENALVFRCKPFQRERNGYKGVTDGDGYVIGSVQGSKRKLDAMKAARKGKGAWECTRQSINMKGNLSNY